MKKKNLPALGFALVLLLVFVIAASIDYRALNSNQFTTSGTVTVISGARLTNSALITPGLNVLKNLGGLTIMQSTSNAVGETATELGTGFNPFAITINHNTTGGTNLLLRDPVSGSLVITVMGDVAYMGGTGITNLNLTSLTHSNAPNISVTNLYVYNAMTGGVIYVTTANVGGFETDTNTWTINTAFDLLIPGQFLSQGASTVGITGIASGPTTTARFNELSIKATGDITFTNPVAFITSDLVDSRTITNGNNCEIAIKVRPGISTNMAIVQFR